MALLEVENLQTHFRTPGGINLLGDGLRDLLRTGRTA